MQQAKQVYNLEFPAHINELNIAGYRFIRIEKYEEALMRLQQLVETISEFHIVRNTGAHQQTATVEIPDTEEPAILPWEESSGFTKLEDVLLLLTLFTSRNVFVLTDEEAQNPLRPDPRGLFYGGQFVLSAHLDVWMKHKETGEILREQDIPTGQAANYDPTNAGLEMTVNKVLATISTEQWCNEYHSGYFLFLFRQAMRQSDIEPAFILCWTIWEHLFSIKNQKWLDQPSIEKMSGGQKIGFILNTFFNIKINDAARQQINRITRTRNRLIHFGIKTADVEHKEMTLFVRLTEQLMAITLELKPSNAFNSLEHLEQLISR